MRHQGRRRAIRAASIIVCSFLLAMGLPLAPASPAEPEPVATFAPARPPPPPLPLAERYLVPAEYEENGVRNPDQVALEVHGATEAEAFVDKVPLPQQGGPDFNAYGEARNGAEHYAVIAPGPINSRDAHGNWVERSLQLREGPSGWNYAGLDYAVRFPRNLGSHSPVRFEIGPGAIKSFPEVPANQGTSLGHAHGSKVTYASALPSTDVEYLLTLGQCGGCAVDYLRTYDFLADAFNIVKGIGQFFADVTGISDAIHCFHGAVGGCVVAALMVIPVVGEVADAIRVAREAAALSRIGGAARSLEATRAIGEAAEAGELATVGPGIGIGPGAAHVSDPAFSESFHLFHGTDVGSAENIIENGISRSAAARLGGGDAFYTTIDRETAGIFAAANPAEGAPAIVGINLSAGIEGAIERGIIDPFDMFPGTYAVRDWELFNEIAAYGWAG